MIVAFYTKETPYVQIVENLRASLLKHGLEHEIVGVEDRGSWCKNTMIKPQVILDALLKYQKPIWYIDADAVVNGPLPEDMGDKILCLKLLPDSYSTGCIYFPYNQVAISFLEEWVERCKKHDWSDQGHFNKMDVSNVAPLPSNYNKIFDKKGEAIIVHYQASRQYRYPKNNLKNVRISNCEYWLPRHDKVVEAYMDQNYTKIAPLRWTVKKKEFKKVGSICNIVGKGPSLDYINPSCFRSDFIICINNSIHRVEKEVTNHDELYVLQQDISLEERCRPTGGATLLLSPRVWGFYKDCKKILIDPRHYRLGQNSLSVIVAMAIARDMGADTVNLISFDASVNKKTDYAKCIGSPSNKNGKGEGNLDPKRFLNHHSRILQQASELGLRLEWTTPEPEIVHQHLNM